LYLDSCDAIVINLRLAIATIATIATYTVSTIATYTIDSIALSCSIVRFT
jgi:hypothetical protein